MRKHKITVFNETAEILGVGQVGLSESGELLADASSLRRVPRPENCRISTARAIVSGPQGGDDAAVSAKAPVDCRAGAIGVEFASLYSALGTKVTLIEAAANVLPAEDEEISALAKAALSEEGIEIHTNTPLDALSGKSSCRPSLPGKPNGLMLASCRSGYGEHRGIGLDRVGLVLSEAFWRSTAISKQASLGFMP